jgi:hypothetical protein
MKSPCDEQGLFSFVFWGFSCGYLICVNFTAEAQITQRTAEKGRCIFFFFQKRKHFEVRHKFSALSLRSLRLRGELHRV